MQISLFFITSMVLFFIGAFGTFLNRRNFITMLMCIEIMLLSVNINLFTAASILDDMAGVLLALFVMTVAAAETAIGLALCVIYHRLRATLDVEFINLLKG